MIDTHFNASRHQQVTTNDGGGHNGIADNLSELDTLTRRNIELQRSADDFHRGVEEALRELEREPEPEPEPDQALGENNENFDEAVQTLHTALENGDVGESRGGFLGMGGEQMITKEQLENLAQPDSDASSDVRNAAQVLISSEQDGNLALLDRAGPSNAPQGGNYDPLRGPSVSPGDELGDDTYSISDTKAFIEMFGAN